MYKKNGVVVGRLSGMEQKHDLQRNPAVTEKYKARISSWQGSKRTNQNPQHLLRTKRN